MVPRASALGLAAALVTTLGIPAGATPPQPAPAPFACGENDKAWPYDPGSDHPTEAPIACSRSGPKSYSAKLSVQTVAEGIKLAIDALDDKPILGAAGAPLKGRDAVLVFAHGRGTLGAEMPLAAAAHGYHGELVVPFRDLGKLTDEGSRIELSILDHDKKPPAEPEELRIAVVVSTGKGCEKALDESVDDLSVGAKKLDLSAAELGAPMRTTDFFASCNLADEEHAQICVAVKGGKPVGVTVAVSPENRAKALCIDHATRALRFVSSERLDVIRQSY